MANDNRIDCAAQAWGEYEPDVTARETRRKDAEEAVALQKVLTDRFPQYRHPEGLFAWARVALNDAPNAQHLRGLILKVLDRWWPFVPTGASMAARNLHKELVDGVQPDAPIPMILHCPSCGVQHIDEPDEREMLFEGVAADMVTLWDNPPHRSHLCHGCGHIWRPADVPTTGVATIQTRGKNDSPESLAPQMKTCPQCLAVHTDDRPAAQFHFMSGDKDALRVDLGDRRFAVFPLHYSDIPDDLAEKALRATVPGGSSVRDWFMPHESDKAKRNVLDAMKCALFATRGTK